MRQIERDIIGAFIRGENKRKDNTESKDGVLYLHGNDIAKILDDGSVWVSNAGWHTRTTRSRINALCTLIRSDAYVFIKDYTMYIIDHRGVKDIMNGSYFCIKGGE